MEREGDTRIALIAGFIFTVILCWFPPFGIIISSLLTGFIAAKPKEGTVFGAILAALGAVIQITFVTKVLPILGIAVEALGFVPFSLPGILNAFGPLSDIFTGIGGFLVGTTLGGGLALFMLYCALGALCGFIGGIVR